MPSHLSLVTTGLDPVVHADFPAQWIAGSSPAMTKQRIILAMPAHPSFAHHHEAKILFFS